jgi:hypothetical protein
MKSRRFFRFRQPPQRSSQWNSWTALLFLLVLIVALVLMRDRMASGAASCFVHMTEDSASPSETTPHDTSLIQVIRVPSEADIRTQDSL